MAATLLTLIWTSALVLIAGAIAWMSSLVVARIFRQRADRRRKAERGVVTLALVGMLQGASDAPARLQPFGHRARLISEALLELLALVRGADRERVLETLRGMGVVQTLAQRLGQGSMGGRMASIEALAAFGGDEALQALRQGVDRGPAPLRIAALKAFVEAGGAITVGRLLDYLASGEIKPSHLFNDIIRRVTAADPGPTIQALKRTDLQPSARAGLLEALGAAGDYNALPLLMDETLSKAPDCRAAALRGLGRLMHPAAEGAIAQSLEDPVWYVRAAAAEAAGAAGLSRLEDRLAERLADPVWWVRFRAGEALARLGEAGLSRLRQLSETDRSEPAQWAASQALAERRAG